MADALPRVTAVLVTYQSADTIREALRAAGHAHAEGLLDAVVVDNDSRDATAEIVSREFAWARLLLTGKNNGFGRGCNIGLAEVATEYTVFINPDAVVEPAAIRTLMGFLDANPRAGVVGPAIVEAGEGGVPVLQQTGRRFTPFDVIRGASRLGRRRPLAHPIVPGAAGEPTGWVCGAVLMARTDLLKKLSGFDPRFFLYWEETDLCKRVNDAGFEVWALGAAVAHHVGGASSSTDTTRIGGCIAKHYFQSRFYYMVKHHGWPAAASAELGECAVLCLRTVADLLRGRGAGWLRSRRQAPLFSQPERR